MGSTSGSSKSQRMNGLVGAEVLVLLVVCSLPYALAAVDTDQLKGVLLNGPSGPFREWWHNGLEYRIFGGRGWTIEWEDSNNKKSAEVFARRLERLTEAAIDRVPHTLLKPSLCFDRYNNMLWMAAMLKHNGKPSVPATTTEVEGAMVVKTAQPQEESPCRQLLLVVRATVEKFGEEKLLEHFLQIESVRCTLGLGVIDENWLSNSRFVTTQNQLLGRVYEELGESEEAGVFAVAAIRGE